MHKVSIIVPVYNTSSYLVRCLDSIRAQTLKDLDVIIINDGSTDNSEKICIDYINRNNLNWRLFTKSNGGLSSARRYGWERSNGDCIVFVDSDDDLHPDYCQLMYEAIKATDSQLAICGYNLCNDASVSEYRLDYHTITIENVLIDYSKRIIFDIGDGERLPGFLWMRMMKRNLISIKCFMDENKMFAEDQVFDLAYSQEVKRIAVVSKPLYNYYINPGSLTLKYRANMLDMMSNLCAYYYKFLISNDLLDDDASIRLEKLKIEGIISALVNSIRFGGIKAAKTLMGKIRKDTKYIESFEYLRARSCLNSIKKVWWFFIKNNIITIPYAYYKLRCHLK